MLQSDQPKIAVNKLKKHPKNQEYFDNMEGEGWNDFVRSVRTSGVTNAITITPDGTIISGHQRVRACKLLGIDEIKYSVIEYTNEELEGEYPKDVKDLIESNLKQRVAGNANPVKLGKCIVFLEGYYGIEHGGDRKSKDNNCLLIESDDPSTEAELAKRFDISVSTLKNYKMLTNMIPELEDLVDTGIVSPTTARAIMKQMSEEDQRKLIEMLPKDEKLSNREVEFYKQRVNTLTEENKQLRDNVSATKVVKEEVVPEDYSSIKEENKTLKEQIKTAKEETVSANKEIKKFEAEIKKLEERLETAKTDNNRMRHFSMDNIDYSVDKPRKIIDALSRVQTVVEDQILPLLHNDDLRDLEGALFEKSDEFFDYIINIMNDCKVQLHTGRYVSANEKNIIDIN